jgi:beta-lactamase class A
VTPTSRNLCIIYAGLNKILVPAAARKPEFSAQLNPTKMLFVASAIKTFVLCEALRQADSPDVESVLEAKKLKLDSSVWSLGSPTFNPPISAESCPSAPR